MLKLESTTKVLSKRIQGKTVHHPTIEQKAIIEHDLKCHATVLAVAGSGKTSTMVQRIQYLVASGIHQGSIGAVMYNKSAQQDFKNKLLLISLSSVDVRTFHSIGDSILKNAVESNIIHPMSFINENFQRKLEKQAVYDASVKYGTPQNINYEEFRQAVSIWKSMLTPPEEAQHLQNSFFTIIYNEYESLRKQNFYITYDDQIYDAVRLLESDRKFREKWSNILDYIIIDEFQDVNFARLRLMKIIVGTRTKVMVVGDDDQCIYEWQGAMPSFIKNGFEEEFTYYPHSHYKLTHSFRFGPVIAQLAANVISNNADRVKKYLVANDISKLSEVTIDVSNSGLGIQQALMQIKKLIEGGAKIGEIVVLVSKYSQSYSMQNFFFTNEIPFFAEGGLPIKNSKPIQIALRYLNVATNLYQPITPIVAGDLLEIANFPSRFVKKEYFKNLLQAAIHNYKTAFDVLSDSSLLIDAGLTRDAVSNLNDLGLILQVSLCNTSLKTMSGGQEYLSGEIIVNLLNRINFSKCFDFYLGPSDVEDNLEIMRSLAISLYGVPITSINLDAYSNNHLDTTRGLPAHKCIRITSIFKAKGLEWDHIFLPGLIEGQIPDLRPMVNVCLNTKYPERNANSTAFIESQRRLFYVALTRARKSLYLFADPDKDHPLSRFVTEAYVEETRCSVKALQEILSYSKCSRSSIEKIRTGLNANVQLRDGLLRMIKRNLSEVPYDFEKSNMLNEVILALGIEDLLDSY